jgi:hypothetical protein
LSRWSGPTTAANYDLKRGCIESWTFSAGGGARYDASSMAESRAVEPIPTEAGCPPTPPVGGTEVDIDSCLRVIRGQTVILDSDLAHLYGVPAKHLNQAVKRNPRKFPSDFVFQLTPAELEALGPGAGRDAQRGGRRYRPYAFTEQGTGMVASVLRTQAATRVSIAILRAFARARSQEQSDDGAARKARSLFRAIRDALLLLPEDLPYATRSPYTYFIQAGVDGPIKIGSTKNLPVRFRTLCAMSPVPLRLLGLIEGDHEEACHARLAAFRLHGEWFVAADFVLEFIRSNASTRASAGSPTRRRRRASST